MAMSTKEPGNDDLDDALVVVGKVNLRRTHPGLYGNAMTLAVVCVLLGLNFAILDPTFLIYGMPNLLWGAIFLALGGTALVCLNLYRSLRVVRVAMAVAVGYFIFLGLGTMQPWIEGEGSLQLSILYFAMAFVYRAALVEPFINPWTAERE